MIPTAALHDSISLYATTGTTGYGTEVISPVPVIVPASVAPAKGSINLPNGDASTIAAVAYIRPGRNIGLMDKVIWRTRIFRVAAVEFVYDDRGEAMHAVTLAGPFTEVGN